MKENSGQCEWVRREDIQQSCDFTKLSRNNYPLLLYRMCLGWFLSAGLLFVILTEREILG